MIPVRICRSCKSLRPLAELVLVTPTDGRPSWYVCRPQGGGGTICFRLGTPSRMRATISLADAQGGGTHADDGATVSLGPRFRRYQEPVRFSPGRPFPPAPEVHRAPS